ncbi:MAG: outer membrane beta-barrel protein, partial [Flavobacterium sp.]|nr:outer membrane beta-barrel protein [Flavobacterium sp.]
MNNKIKSIKRAYSSLKEQSVLILLVFILGFQFASQAQETIYTRPSWYFGVAAGSNLNFYRGTTQNLNSDLTVPAAFHNGFGSGLFIAPSIEYYKPNSVLGLIFQAGFDDRSASFDQVMTVCNCPADLKTKTTYLTIEPSLRIAPFRNDFYIYGGPRFAFNLENSFRYQLGINPDFPDQEPTPAVRGDFSDTEKSIISMQVGMGYDIMLSSVKNKTQFVVSPYIAFHPYFGQNPRSSESWNISTVRAGIVLKFGQGKKIESLSEVPTNKPYTFSVNSPTNANTAPIVSETFPLRNYVFFDLGSTEIPSRYVLLNKNQVKEFKEDQLETSKPINLSGRSDRGMIVYYNILNILGDRMQKNPSTTIKLVGSSEKGPEDGKLMAESIKTYLTSVFEISPNRITIEGRTKPKLPSEQVGGTLELELLRQGDRRVSIESSSPELLMEFQSGPNAPLKPIVLTGPKVAPESSHVTFNLPGAKEAFTVWNVEVKDEKGNIQKYGPYTEESASIPTKTILGTREEGHYTISLIGITPEGQTIREDKEAHVVLWKPSVNEESTRYSVIYDFNNAEAIKIYEDYLSKVVAPKIPKNGRVVINGYTDVI